MELYLDTKLASQYKSPSQRIRVLTEAWVDSQIFCPSCGDDINRYENNKPVADFYCQSCREEYELKSKKNSIGTKVVDGAYRTMLQRLESENNPSLFLLNYQKYEVTGFFVIPKHFFIPEVIEKRQPLSAAARRAGWVGCNILLKGIPQTGKIFYIKDGKIESKSRVLENWKRTLFLREEKEAKTKGWILNIMNCIDRLDKKEFSLSEIYNFEQELGLKYPNNKHIKDKIRQQLQFLRDKGYLEFIEKGKYSVV
ncbi:MAG: restriction endonuclease [Omnitrophica WOR_2 bacterium RIFCSPHIGHO2_01_FULL_49_10]|nr:MAG: restriction endonuclease [Candidatus Uhrbacteria bacterium RIFCSPLOWO2_12_FULL_47_9]OGX29671.1 MAG: restriction endonuclease [Omnitrophica WOR_2 bacterium RIFCSPHIGHO2_01_FULL_49_10]OGX32665.1 MAG: restriction endonuclease [Omnitrophica WOR_2 bacterium RIFCSPLOWO2_02_FULL_50_19]OHD84861.1 MAG: restriction endonuclease [Sulfuricurvum sp. RIFCSPHIGHO2_12_FULL_44_8]